MGDEHDWQSIKEKVESDSLKMPIEESSNEPVGTSTEQTYKVQKTEKPKKESSFNVNFLSWIGDIPRPIFIWICAFVIGIVLIVGSALFMGTNFMVRNESNIPKVVNKVKTSVVTVFNGGGQGSGFFVSEDGYFVTNAHVISEKTGVIQLFEKTKVDYYVVLIDEEKDIALLKTNEGHYSFLRLGNSTKARVGETVLAVGSPLTINSTFTKGIISNKHDKDKVSIIQTDAAINPGNSGGPLLNSAGEVIGINTAKMGRGAEGIGFAVAIDDVKSLVERGKKLTEQERIDGIEAFMNRRSTVRTASQERSDKSAEAQFDAERRAREQYERTRGALLNCMNNAEKQYRDSWNNQCTLLSLRDGCGLPHDKAIRMDSLRTEARQVCLQMYPQR